MIGLYNGIRTCANVPVASLKFVSLGSYGINQNANVFALSNAINGKFWIKIPASVNAPTPVLLVSLKILPPANAHPFVTKFVIIGNIWIKQPVLADVVNPARQGRHKIQTHVNANLFVTNNVINGKFWIQ